MSEKESAMSMKERKSVYDVLFDPVKIGPVTIKNRLALAPTNNLFSQNYLMGDKSLGFYAARAKGGLGLLIVEATFTYEEPMETPAPRLWSAIHTPGMAEIVKVCHSYGAKAFIQLSPGTGVQGQNTSNFGVAKAPSNVPLRAKLEDLPKTLVNWFLKTPLAAIPYSNLSGDEIIGDTPSPLTEEEIEERIRAMARSSKLAVRTGFDGVEMHACHGWLIHNFLSPRYNRRTDKWGGSLENRMRFLIRLVEECRKAIGPDFALGVRLSMDERNPDGIHLEEMKQVAAACAKTGADYIHLSDGCIEQCKYFLPEVDGSMVEGAEAFKKAAGENVVIITPNLHDPELAARTVNEGKTDMVSSSRVFMADAEWANKVRDGRIKEIKKCSRCNLCIYEFEMGRPIRCAVNKELGYEYLELKDLIKIKRSRGGKE